MQQLHCCLFKLVRRLVHATLPQDVINGVSKSELNAVEGTKGDDLELPWYCQLLCFKLGAQRITNATTTTISRLSKEQTFGTESKHLRK